MKITLYKGCILTNKYNDVIHYSALESYLNTLQKRPIQTESEFYLEHKGSIVLDISYFGFTPPYYTLMYNYMKIENKKFTTEYEENRDNPLSVFYAFITDIKVKNEVVILYYEEDVFSTWQKDIKIGASVLVNSRNLRDHNLERDFTFYKLPLEYEGNNKLRISNSLSEQSNMGNNDRYYLIIKGQYYKLASGTSAEIERENVVGIYGSALNVGDNIDTNLNGVINTINMLIKNKNTTTYNSRNSTGYYLDVNECYVLPKNFFDSSLKIQYRTITVNNEEIREIDYKLILDANGMYLCDFETVLKQNTQKELYLEKYNIKTLSIANDFTQLSIGTLSTQIPKSKNGSGSQLTLSIIPSPYEFNLFIEFDNNLIDITNDFLVDAPIESIDTETYQLRKMNIESKNKYADRQIIDSGISSAQNILKSFSNISTGIFSLANRDISGISKIANAGSQLLDVAKNMNDIASIEEQTKLRNAEIYENAKAVSTKSFGLQNAIINLIALYIVPDNATQVENIKNIIGYKVYEVIKDILEVNVNEIININTNFNGYDIMKFSFVRIYGSISQEINIILENIFLNGFRIWFTENINV